MGKGPLDPGHQWQVSQGRHNEGYLSLETSFGRNCLAGEIAWLLPANFLWPLGPQCACYSRLRGLLWGETPQLNEHTRAG